MSEKDSRCMLLQALSLSRLVSSSSMVHASGLTLTSLNVERLLHRARTSSYRGERSTLHSTTHPTYLQVHMEHVLATSQITYWKSEYLTVAVDSCARHPRQLSAHRQRVPSRLLATYAYKVASTSLFVLQTGDNLCLGTCRWEMLSRTWGVSRPRIHWMYSSEMSTTPKHTDLLAPT